MSTLRVSPDNCPFCNASLQGDPIPEKYLHHNVPGEPFYDENRPTCDEQKAHFGRCHCLPYGEGKTHFRREIGHEVPEVYDGVLFWRCPDCGGMWHRWTGELEKKATVEMRKLLG